MSNITLTEAGNPASTMTSIELLALINAERKAFGEAEVRHNDFSARCKDELDGEHYETFVVTNPNATTTEVLDLTLDQCSLVAMRESKGVRRTVLAKLKAKQQAIPSSFAEALRLAADEHERRQIAEAQRDEAVRTKAQIGSKREATAMAKASQAVRQVNKLTDELGHNARHATVIAVEKATGRKFKWLELRRHCKAHGLTTEKVQDPRWGEATAWPAEAWRAAYGVELAELFPEVALET